MAGFGDRFNAWDRRITPPVIQQGIDWGRGGAQATLRNLNEYVGEPVTRAVVPPALVPAAQWAGMLPSGQPPMARASAPVAQQPYNPPAAPPPQYGVMGMPIAGQLAAMPRPMTTAFPQGTPHPMAPIPSTAPAQAQGPGGVPLAFQTPLPGVAAPTPPAPSWANVPLPSGMRVATPAAHPDNWQAGVPEAGVMLPPGMSVPNPNAQGPDWSQVNAAPGTPTQAYAGGGEASEAEKQTLLRLRGQTGQPAEYANAAKNAAEARLHQMGQAAELRVAEAQAMPQGAAPAARGATGKQQAIYAHGPDGLVYNTQTGEIVNQPTPRAVAGKPAGATAKPVDTKGERIKIKSQMLQLREKMETASEAHKKDINEMLKMLQEQFDSIGAEPDAAGQAPQQGQQAHAAGNRKYTGNF